MRFADIRTLAIVTTLLLLATGALAQEQMYDDYHSPDVESNTTVAPIAVPTLDDFAPPETPVAGSDAAPSGAADKSLLANSGVETYVEVTSKQKAGLLTPYYKYSEALKFKARIPLIYNRTTEFAVGDAQSSGIGDITLESEFKRYLSKYRGLASVQLSLKMPTGDDDPGLDDNFNPKPKLGTGTWDLIAKTAFARSTPTAGWVAALLYRKNSSTETVTEYAYSVDTYTSTSAAQLVASGFYRRQYTPKLWWVLGTTLTMLGDGGWENVSTPQGGGAATTTSGDLGQGGQLVDIYPGFTYRMGAFNPFVGLRIPLMTNLDAGDVDRDMALIVQFSYRPGGISGD